MGNGTTVAARKTDKAIIQVRVDAKTKDKVARLFKRQGLSTSDGMRLLINQALAETEAGHVPNANTRKAIEEGLAETLKPVTRADIRKMWEDA